MQADSAPDGAVLWRLELAAEPAGSKKAAPAAAAGPSAHLIDLQGARWERLTGEDAPPPPPPPSATLGAAQQQWGGACGARARQQDASLAGGAGSLVGRRVAVFWKAEGCSFPGLVTDVYATGDHAVGARVARPEVAGRPEQQQQRCVFACGRMRMYACMHARRPARRCRQQPWVCLHALPTRCAPATHPRAAGPPPRRVRRWRRGAA